jgi:hypothetical protein
MTLAGQTTALGAVTHTAPFFMFTTSRFADAAERDAIRRSLGRYVTGSDYLSVGLVREFPELRARVERAHRYVLLTSLGEIQREIAGGCDPEAPGLLVYDGEHWPATPAGEQANMAAAIARAKAIATASRCYDFGVAPDGRFMGVQPDTCSYDLAAAIHRQVDWEGVALVDIQAQVLISDRCANGGSVDPYAKFVAAIAHDIRAIARPPAIAAQLSFRDTPPDRMIAAIQQLRDTIDGFYVAYPSNVGVPCRYCSPANLEQVLRAIRSG